MIACLSRGQQMPDARVLLMGNGELMLGKPTCNAWAAVCRFSKNSSWGGLEPAISLPFEYGLVRLRLD